MVGWPLEMGKGVRVENCIRGTGMSFPKRSNPVKKPVSTYPWSSQVVNKGRVGKCHSYYQFIMKAEGMKNCSVRIIHAQQTVSPAFHTWGFSMNNLKFDLKHLVAINSLVSSMFSSLGRFVINLRCSTCPPVIEPGLSSFRSFPLPIQLVQNCSPVHSFKTFACRVYLGRAMVASQSTGKGHGVAEL
jgi:hypothetical protein